MTTLPVPGGDRPLDLIGLGECMVEFYASEALGRATSLNRSYGGDVLNALVSAARLGSRTGFITRVGSDPFGEGLLREWQLEGIDTTCAPLTPGENGVYFISLHDTGEREFTYRRAGSAASQLTEADVQAQYIASARVLLLSGITQAISASAQAATLRAARIAREVGTLVAYDPNYRPSLWATRGGESDAHHAFQEVMPFVDVLLPSFPADSIFTLRTPNTAERALAAFMGAAPVIALKAGAEGAWLANGHHAQHAMPVAGTRVVDTTGAGDAWNGAFLHALIAGQPLTDALRLANETAARKLSHRGAIPPREHAPHPFITSRPLRETQP